MTSPRLDDTLRDPLLADHRRIDALVSTLAGSLDADAGAASSLAWRQLETAVLAHIDQEELHLLPAFEAARPADAAALRAEHVRFRTALGELGVALALRRVGAHEVRAFGEQLRAHAAREDASLYPWADRSASPYHARAARAPARGALSDRARTVDATGHRLGDVIASEAREFRADLLVLGSQGRRGAKRWMLGRVAESAARAATMPTLIVHPPA